MTSIKPSPLLEGVVSYNPPQALTPVDLRLDGNEGVAPEADILEEVLRIGPESIRCYPNKSELEQTLAASLNIDPECLLLTAGADDALERIIRSVCAPGREAVLPVPTFGMILRYAALTGCKQVQVPWLNPEFPLDNVLAEIRPETSLVGVVTPSSPFGFTASPTDLEAISEAAPNALLLVDLAYTDFADEDLTSFSLTLPNVVVTRTLSKAYGLAGLRVGYVAGPKDVIEWLRVVGHPYAVSAPSIAMARASLERGRERRNTFIACVKSRREELSKLLESLGANAHRSQGNFVFTEPPDPEWLRDGLAAMGIGIRVFPNKNYIGRGARITVPGEDVAFERLKEGLRTALRPEAILFDVDDTLVDVSESYKRAVIETAKKFGATLTFADIATAKASGGANNEWEMTQRLLKERGVDAPLEEVTEVFEALYQGTDEQVGLKSEERLLVDPSLFGRLKKKVKIGIVTGRPRADAEEFLVRFGLKDLFEVVITMDDGPLKPDPTPVKLAMKRLGVNRAWMIGDTPDDVRAARAAGAIGIGVVAPADDENEAGSAMLRAGAGRVLANASEIEEILR